MLSLHINALLKSTFLRFEYPIGAALNFFLPVLLLQDGLALSDRAPLKFPTRRQATAELGWARMNVMPLIRNSECVWHRQLAHKQVTWLSNRAPVARNRLP